MATTEQTLPPQKIEIRPQPGPQELFLSTNADIIIYGGAAFGGKTFALLMESLRWVQVPNFSAVILRRLTEHVRKEGGLWDQSCEIYPLFNARGSEHSLKWRFPSGATVGFGHIQHEKDLSAWQGSQIPFIGFDELTHFTERMFFYMMSRNRSATGIPGYIRATTNPDVDSWVAKFISWWIDQDTGFAIPERAGKIRWFIRLSGMMHWADTPDELRAKFGSEQRPKSVTFIPAKITDNKIGMANDPNYLASLMALPLVDRERLLGGNWKIRNTAGNIFKRDWFDIVEVTDVPSCKRGVRSWDFAGTVVTEKNPDPDWTAGLRVDEGPDNVYYIRHLEHLRATPHNVEQRVLSTARQDSFRIDITIPEDPGQASIKQVDDYVTLLAGYPVTTMRPDKDKVTRAKPASSLAEKRKLKLVRGSWNEVFLAELENFPEGAHDDIVDTLSDAVAKLTGTRGGQFQKIDREDLQGRRTLASMAGHRKGTLI